MQIKFEVGAKAARLIGRENITDVDGALIELIKNAYDADASCVYVKFDMPFPEIPEKLSFAELNEIMSEQDYHEIQKFYDLKETYFVKKEMGVDEIEILQYILSKYNRIILIDNGIGMNGKTVRTSWMQIGTSDKENQIKSAKGRIKTGAKGIGRFALDKLSLRSQMYTSEMGNSTLHWQVDWNQFSNAKLLRDVKASLEVYDDSYNNICKNLMGDDYEKYESYGWTHGTAFVLSPCRGEWSQRLFEKVNYGLKSVNPLGFSDTFDIYINNVQKPNNNFCPTHNAIGDDYDYQIDISYDGDKELIVNLMRNEVDIKKTTVNVKFSTDVTKRLSLSDFWDRPAFRRANYKRQDFDKQIRIKSNIYELLGKKDSIEKIRRVGAFKARLFFLKNANSDYGIIKKVAVRNRRALLDNFSGIKIYRDNFKVRPYGDPGSLKDWLDLSARQQTENQPVTNPTAPWRVLPYQIIGSINIGRITNPELEDMANRESLVMNESYYIFQDILKAALSLFEYDRQYIYREYKKWVDEKRKIYLPATERVKNYIENRKADQNNQLGKNFDIRESEFSNKDYEDTVEELLADEKERLHSEQILHMIADAGLIMNTFFHEFRSIATQLIVRAPQLRRCVNYLLNYEPFSGNEIYNPYSRITDLQEQDDLLKDWLDIAMLGIEQDYLEPEILDIKDEIFTILSKWESILSKRYIHVNYNVIEEKISIKISRTDLYIIMNNFILNAVSYLEKCTAAERIISIYLKKKEQKLIFIFENNGPMLDSEMMSMPDRIFELGVSTKVDSQGKKGTGVGLWAVREAVNRNKGHISVDLNRKSGFGLLVELPMEDENV